MQQKFDVPSNPKARITLPIPPIHVSFRININNYFREFRRHIEIGLNAGFTLAMNVQPHVQIRRVKDQFYPRQIGFSKHFRNL